MEYVNKQLLLDKRPTGMPGDDCWKLNEEIISSIGNNEIIIEVKYLSIDQTEHPDAFKQFEEPIFTLDYFNDLCDTFRSPHIWKYSNGKWRLRNPVK